MCGGFHAWCMHSGCEAKEGHAQDRKATNLESKQKMDLWDCFVEARIKSISNKI
jgi:hypothetical protein